MSEFEYELPTEQIAQHPISPRDSARLLVDTPQGLEDAHVRDLASFLEPGDLLVLNRTRVLRARLALRKSTGGAVEVLLLEPRSSGDWEALVRPSKKVKPGTVLTSVSDNSDLQVIVGEDLGSGRRLVRLEVDGVQIAPSDIERHLTQAGVMPLPPYITETLEDSQRYQTVFAETPGSVAAPTAGLHFTDELLESLRSQAIAVAHVELHVGLDTFRPVMTEDSDDHVMHSERFIVAHETLDACASAKRVIAVGTTSVRALESAALGHTGRTDLYIQRGFEFKVVDLMLTNFHLSRSSLLLMVDAFVGPRWKDIYRTAIDRNYRFLSFGDTMLLSRSDLGSNGSTS